jgi:hypothetical protein
MKTPCLRRRGGGGVRAMPRLCIIPWHSPYNWGNITENPQSGKLKSAQLISAGAIQCWFGHRFMGGLDWSADVSHLSLHVRSRGSTLGQCKCLPSCRTKGFPTPANFESYVSVRGLMCSMKSCIPKPSWICLLLMWFNLWCHSTMPPASLCQLVWIVWSHVIKIPFSGLTYNEGYIRKSTCKLYKEEYM